MGILVFLAWIFMLRRRSVGYRRPLGERGERHTQLMETAPDAIFIEYEGRFDYLNPASVKLLGIGSAQELIGHSVLENVHERTGPASRRASGDSRTFKVAPGRTAA